ncbi:cyclic nucleotide-binding domain-containing protein [Magnetococcus sp. PR-3]|uniref:cyclic nucleotide-binding domain-containing protein n=1 Tax=Magnetococcus sp. PR-3 TaxID=3120355 RepID=UPI002FCE67D1
MKNESILFQKIILLQSFPLFAHLSRNTLTSLAASVEEKTHPSGTILFKKGDPGHTLHAICCGQVTVTLEPQPAQTLGRGDVVGEIALLTQRPRSATVMVTEHARLLTLDRNHFLDLVAEDPQALQAMTTMVLQRFLA